MNIKEIIGTLSALIAILGMGFCGIIAQYSLVLAHLTIYIAFGILFVLTIYLTRDA